jgi:hypothetical protein
MITGNRFGGRPVNIWTFLLSWTLLLCPAVIDCGGTGGDSGAAPGLTYSGATAQALITSENAQAITANAMDDGMGGAGTAGIAGLDEASRAEDGTGRPILLGVAMVMESAVAEMDRQSKAQSNPTSALQSDADTYSGSCGGKYSYNIKYDTVTGVFSGSLVFNGYCEGGVTLNGSTYFSGVLNIGMEQVDSCTMRFNSLTGTASSVSETMGGQVYLAQSGAATMLTMDMMVRDNNTGRVCKIENYQMDRNDRGTHADITVNGRFYDPDYGYVDLETTTAFLAAYADDYPYAGQLVASGEIGTAGGPTRARLTALSATQCQVEADTDGDGAYDYDSGAVPWTSL